MQLIPHLGCTKDVDGFARFNLPRKNALFKDIPPPQKRNKQKAQPQQSSKNSKFIATNPENYWEQSAQIELNMKGLNVSNNQKIQNFENDVFSVIKQNPQIKFYIFFPPRSIICLRQMREEDIELRRYIMERLTSLPNVEFYDFESNTEVVTHLGHYQDPSHYYGHINDWMVECFVSKKDHVTSNSIDAFQKRFEHLWSEDVKIIP
jgi:hypothetical protein